MKPAAPDRSKLIGLAVLGGALAGAAALYVNGAVLSMAGRKQRPRAWRRNARSIPVMLKRFQRQLSAMLRRCWRPIRPKQLSSLAFKGPYGKPLSIGDFKGRTVLLNLWATWCVPCREEMPALDALQAKAGDAAFEVVAVNVDAGEDQGKRQRFLTDTGIKSLRDYSEPTMSLFNATKREGLALGLPVTLLIGKDGCLLAAMNGPANWAGADALKLIETAKEN